MTALTDYQLDVALPDDCEWVDYGDRSSGIHVKGLGYVTIDWKLRVFRAGLTWQGKPCCKSHAGRGWQQRLVDDAVDYARKEFA